MLTEFSGIDGDLPSGRIVIVASRYNEAICDSLVRGSIQTLTDAGYAASDLRVIRVPGAWELVISAANALDREDVSAVITLGCVIKVRRHTTSTSIDPSVTR